MAEPEPEGEGGAAPVERKYEVQRMQLVCTWRFGAGFNDTCFIDKTSLYEQSLDGQANNIEDQTHDSWFIATGECNHSFHADNIKKFIERGKAVCPVCNAPWVEKSLVSINQMLGSQ